MKRFSDYGVVELPRSGGSTARSPSVFERSKHPPIVGVHGALLVVYVIFGGSSIVCKFGIHAASPVVFELLRESLVAPVLCAAGYAITGRLAPDGRDILPLLLAGACFFVNQFCYFLGLKLSDPITAATWQTSLPIYTTILAVVVGYEQVSVQKVIGISIAVAGAVAMVLCDDGGFPHATSVGSGNNVWSHACFVFAILGLSSYIVATKGLVARYSSISVTGWIFAVSNIMYLLVALCLTFNSTILSLVCWDRNPETMDICVRNPLHVPSSMLLPLLYEVVVCSAVAWLLMAWVNRYAKASVVSVYTVAQPLTSSAVSGIIVSLNGATWAHWYGIHPPGLHHMIGMAVITVGMLVLFRDGVLQEAGAPTTGLLESP